MVSRITLVLVMLLPTACKDKEPYKGATGGFGPGPMTQAPDTGPSPAVPPPQGPKPVALVVTSDGTIVMTARPGGRDVEIRKVPGLVHVMSDGTARTLRTRIDKHGKGKAIELVTLTHGDGSRPRDIRVPRKGIRSEMQAAAAADPDLAPRFYHRESLSLVGMAGTSTAWVLATDAFLGGAHPLAERSLMVVDIESGTMLDTLPRFRGRNLAAEAPGRQEECVRRLAGVAPMEGIGGEVGWAAAFSHEFEVCAGAFRLARVQPPRGTPAGSPGAAVFSGGVLTLPPPGPRFTDVIDWRSSRSGDAVVALMALGRGDRALCPWDRPQAGRSDSRSREIRVWAQGMEAPVVAGRAQDLVSVQFLIDHPLPEKVLSTLAGL